MKEFYQKPLFAVENVGMFANSSRDCADSIPKENVNLNDPANCGWELGGGAIVFVVGAACNMDGETMGFACYNNPGEGQYIFRS